MRALTRLIKQDMQPALGVTEPGAVAYAAAVARSRLGEVPEKVVVRLNSGMYKNAFTCGIPGTDRIGNAYAAALGAVAGDPDRKLECLEHITEEDEKTADLMIRSGKVTIQMSEVTSRIFIEASVYTVNEKAVVTIRDSHTNIVKISKNGKVVFNNDDVENDEDSVKPEIHRYTFESIIDYVNTVPVEELGFLRQAFQMNLALFDEGMESSRTTFSRQLFKNNGNQIISEDAQKTASLLCNAAIEARVIGLSKPAMAVTGSGAHGIIATLPLYAEYKVCKCTEEALLRAAALSCLICMYIKEYSGKLSAFCGCAIAAGTGASCGLVLLRGGDIRRLGYAVSNMASSITGMICDGGNQGCVMKGITAVDSAYIAANLAMNDVFIDSIHGINGNRPEDTMRRMGMIASPGMTGTEKTIVDILSEKQNEIHADV